MFPLDSIEYNVEATSLDIFFIFFFTNEAPNAKTVKKTTLQNLLRTNFREKFYLHVHERNMRKVRKWFLNLFCVNLRFASDSTDTRYGI